MGKIPMSSTFINELIDDTSGATAVEYGLIISLIVLAMVFALQSVATTTINMWNDIETRAVDAMTN
jgi:pilus assembly protein Flp/PilA